MRASLAAPPPEPGRDCPLCPRLARYRAANQDAHPDWFNGAVPSFGGQNARLLIVGLAPGLQGANRTGRPFTGDHAGVLLYATLKKFGFAAGAYEARAEDGLRLKGAMISNAVRCAPPQNKPSPAEISTCREFLGARVRSLPELRAIVCLGRIAHASTVAALGLRQKDAPFAHGAELRLAGGRITLFDSYHCSRYNTNTGTLTNEMFESVFARVKAYLEASPA